MDGMPSLFETDMLPISTATKPSRARARGRRRGDDRPRQPDGQWPLGGAINVVLFAGMGGACQGLEDAGFPVHVAVNHDEIAIAAHKALNPHTRHLHADIYEVCPLEATQGRHVNNLWLSPDCRDHSVAKGGAPRSRRVRSMPWQGCRWVGTLRKHGRGPEVVYLENVREIRGWGPLIAKRDPKTGRALVATYSRDQRSGKRNPAPIIRVAKKGERVPVERQLLIRDPRYIGRTYRAWVKHMEKLGIRYEDRDLNCADFGIPTSRKRLFGVGVFTDAPIVWPQPTHAPRKSALVQSGSHLPYRMAAEIVDWSLPLPSIFDRDKDLAEASQKRVAVGVKRYVLEAEKPFLIHLTHHGDRPEIDLEGPLPTITGAHRGEMALVGAAVVPTTHTKSGARVHDGTEPSPTPTAGVKGGELAVVAATVVGAGGRAAQMPPIDITGPLNTSTTKEDRILIAAHLVEHRGRSIGQRQDQPLGAQTQVPHHGVVGTWMVQHNSGVIGHAIGESLSTVTTVGTQQQVAAAYLTEFRGTSRDGQPVTDPAGTMCTGGNRGGGHHGVTAAFMTEYYSVGGQHQGCDAPLNTLTTKDRFAVTGAELASRLSPEMIARARQVANFLRAHGCWDQREFVTVGPWLVVDIGMRMLAPHEAAAAHELRMPEMITVPKRDRKGMVLVGQDGNVVHLSRPLTKTEAMRLVGNSVPKRMAMLLAQANAHHTLYAPPQAKAAA